jgi:hypothetical protein
MPLRVFDQALAFHSVSLYQDDIVIHTTTGSIIVIPRCDLSYDHFVVLLSILFENILHKVADLIPTLVTDQL